MVRLLKSVLMAVGLTLVSCDATIHFYPEADGPAPGKSQIRLDVDWSGYGKTVPTGMTVICHHTETGERARAIDNDISHVTPYLTPGRHWATVFNLTEDEFSYISFRGLDAVETAEVYAPAYNGAKWYKSRGDDSGYVAGQPEWLAVDTIMTDHVTDANSGGMRVIGTTLPQEYHLYTACDGAHGKHQQPAVGTRRHIRACLGQEAGKRFAEQEHRDGHTSDGGV